MELSTPTPPTEPPQESSSSVLDYARAIAAESRRFYQGLTKENIASFLKTMAWAAPLTVLIWVYAESEQQVTDVNQPISIEVTSRDPAKVVMLERGVRSIICDLSGPRSNLDRFKETLSTSTPIVIEVDTRNMKGDEFIPTLDYLRDNPRFLDAGVTVDKSDPASLPVYVDTLEKRNFPVRPPAGLTDISDVSFQPAVVAVSGPQRFVRALGAVTADLSGMPELTQPGQHTVEAPLVPDPSGALTFVPQQVKVKFSVAQTDVTATIPVFVYLEMSPDFAKKWDVTPLGKSVQVDLRGPPDEIDQLKSRQIVPQALLEINDGNVDTATPVPVTIIGLPPGVELAGARPEVTFTATSR